MKKDILSIFKGFENIKIAYLFGSQARKDVGPLSDYDFAIYLDPFEKQEAFEIKSQIEDKLRRALNTDKVQVVLLNTVKTPELSYNIIKEGEVLLEKEPYKILFELKALNQYFDFKQSLLRYGLTTA